MADLGIDPGLRAARGLGSATAVAVSLVYMFPKGHRVAVSRFFTRLCCDLVFSGLAGYRMATRLGVQ